MKSSCAVVCTVPQTTQHNTYTQRAPRVARPVSGKALPAEWRGRAMAAGLARSGWGRAGQPLLSLHWTLARFGGRSSRWAGEAAERSERARALQASPREFPPSASEQPAGKQPSAQATGRPTAGQNAEEKMMQQQSKGSVWNLNTPSKARPLLSLHTWERRISCRQKTKRTNLCLNEKLNAVTSPCSYCFPHTAQPQRCLLTCSLNQNIALLSLSRFTFSLSTRFKRPSMLKRRKIYFCINFWYVFELQLSHLIPKKI